jgi:hypothetical protein
VVDLEPVFVRAELKDGDQVLDVVTIPLRYEGTGYKVLPSGSCDSSENTWKVILVLVCQVSEKEGRLSAGSGEAVGSGSLPAMGQQSQLHSPVPGAGLFLT